jgi:hypothetical protein
MHFNFNATGWFAAIVMVALLWALVSAALILSGTLVWSIA